MDLITLTLFHAAITKFLAPLLETDQVLVHDDNILVASETEEAHREGLTWLFKLLTETGLKLRFR